MKALAKTAGIIVLVAFALMAGSVVCFASAQVAPMGDCGNGMANAVSMCPFMSVSVPAVTNVPTVALLVAFFLTVLVAFGFSIDDGYARKFFAYAEGWARDLAPGRRFDVVISMISDGVLHARTFGF